MPYNFDYNRAFMLLSIVEKVSTATPGFTNISSEAMAELREMNESIRKGKLEQQGLPVTPAPVGDEDSPAPIEGSEDPETNPALDPHPTASAPLDTTTADEGVRRL